MRILPSTLASPPPRSFNLPVIDLGGHTPFIGQVKTKNGRVCIGSQGIDIMNQKMFKARILPE